MRNEFHKNQMTGEEQSSVYVYNNENGKEQSVTLPKELLRQADINSEADLDIACGTGMIVILPSTVLGRIPEELLKFYDSIGVSRETVELVIGAEAEKAGGYDRLLEKMKSSGEAEE